MLLTALNHRVSVQRPTASTDAIFGEVDTPTLPYQNFPASVQPASASWKSLYAARRIDTTHTVYFAGIPIILNGDVILFGARKLFVVGVRDLAGRGQVLAVDAREIT
jgi:hypothetical protein